VAAAFLRAAGFLVAAVFPAPFLTAAPRAAIVDLRALAARTGCAFAVAFLFAVALVPAAPLRAALRFTRAAMAAPRCVVGARPGTHGILLSFPPVCGAFINWPMNRPGIAAAAELHVAPARRPQIA
jgi:hypothetical protein